MEKSTSKKARTGHYSYNVPFAQKPNKIKRSSDPVNPVDDAFKEAGELPAHTAKKPSADEQDGDWSGDRDYEPNE